MPIQPTLASTGVIGLGVVPAHVTVVQGPDPFMYVARPQVLDQKLPCTPCHKDVLYDDANQILILSLWACLFERPFVVDVFLVQFVTGFEEVRQKDQPV